MTKKYLYLCLLIVLCSCFQDDQDNIKEYIYSGEITGYEYKDYRLLLKKHDKLTSNLEANNLEVIIFSPENITLVNDKIIEIENDGEYIIRVLMKRAFARRDRTYEYKLSIKVQ